MGKKSPPTAENSGMTKNSILKYVFVHKKMSTSTLSPDMKPTPASQPQPTRQEQIGDSYEDSSSSSDSSTKPSPSTSAGSPSSLPRIGVNVDSSIFDKSLGNYPSGSALDLNATEENSSGSSSPHDDSGNGTTDNDNGGESSDAEFAVPRIIGVQSLKKTANNKVVPKEKKLSKQAPKRNQVTASGSPRSKKRRGSDGSSSSRSHAESVGSEKKSTKNKGQESLDALIAKKRWEMAIPQLIADVDKNPISSNYSFIIAQVINDCILKSRRTSSTKANEFMERIVSKCGEDLKDDENFEFVLEAMMSLSAVLAELDVSQRDENNCYWPLMRDLMQILNTDALANCAPEGKHVLRFLEAFVELLEKLFKVWKLRKPHLRAPMIVRLFEGVSFDESNQTRLQNLKSNVTQLTQSLLKLQMFEPELSVLSRLLNLLANHYCALRSKKTKEILIDQVSSTLYEAKNYGVRVVGKLEENFRTDVCTKIVWMQLSDVAKSVAHEKLKFLTCLKNSKIIRKHYTDLTQFNTSKEQMCYVTKGTNNAGESILHRLCGDPKKHEKLDLNQALEVIQRSPTGTVNVPDNGNNYPLHDAADNGRLDQLEILRKRCGSDQPIERLRVNPLLRNDNGDTPLHLAAKKGDLKVVKLLVKIIGENEKVLLNLDMANNAGITPMNASNNIEVNEYLQSLFPEEHDWEKDFVFPDCKVRLSPESITKLKTDLYLQQVVVQFNN